MDRAYSDYSQFGRWTDEGVFFVTRMKSDADYRVNERLRLPKHRTIREDALIMLNGAQAREKCPHTLRRVVVWDEANLEFVNESHEAKGRQTLYNPITEQRALSRLGQQWVWVIQIWGGIVLAATIRLGPLAARGKSLHKCLPSRKRGSF